ncbi:MAG: hypothetical protein AAB815_03240 [Patescibacteria group bacterium]
MQNKKLIRFVESFILFPIITMSGSLGGVLPQAGSGIVSTSQFVLSQKENIEAGGLLAYNQALDQKAEILSIKAEAVDAYFKARNMPLFGTGMQMVAEAEKNNLDWRLLAAIAVRESTGGKFDCKKVGNNPFGWGSCKISFKSNAEAIETVGRNLGGNNPKTANHYADKTTIQILRAYNPPSIIPRYAEQVISIMNAIGTEEIELTPTPTTENIS